MLQPMRSFTSRSVLMLLIASSGYALGCSGTIEGSAPVEPAAAAPVAPATTTDEEQPPIDDGEEGIDPGFAAIAGATTTSDDAPPADAEETAATEPPPVESEPAPPKVLAFELLAGEASRQLAAMKVTAYEHTTFVDEATGTFKYDCSGFLGYALSRSAPAHLTAVKAFAAVSRPLAKHYTNFIGSITPGASKDGWSRVARAIDLRPGDVVAWLKPADLVSSNTGHVMIVRGAPAVNPKRPDEIIVPIIDSSASFHGSTDSRFTKGGGGLGQGPIGLVVDGSGAPVKYRWTGGVSAQEWSTTITLGRPE